MLIQHASVSRTVLCKELCWAGGCLSDPASFYFSPGHSILLAPAACCPHKRELCSCFSCADHSLCLEHSSLRYAHGFLLHFLQVFTQRDWLRSLQKNPAPSPLTILLDFSVNVTAGHFTLFICSLCPLGKVVSSHPQGLCLLGSCPGTLDSARLREGADIIC